MNSVVYMYLLSNGEYDFENFSARDNEGSESTKIVLWLLFLGATFLLQIVFMNMLVALMTDVYTEINDKESQSTMREYINLLNDYRNFLDYFDLGLKANYIFVVTPN